MPTNWSVKSAHVSNLVIYVSAEAKEECDFDLEMFLCKFHLSSSSGSGVIKNLVLGVFTPLSLSCKPEGLKELNLKLFSAKVCHYTLNVSVSLYSLSRYFRVSRLDSYHSFEYVLFSLNFMWNASCYWSTNISHVS